MHYLDELMFFGSPGSEDSEFALQLALDVLAGLGIPVSVPKLEGPSTSVTFLGIVIDFETIELRLPHDKVDHMREVVASWFGRMSGCSSDLESLLGQISHAAVVVRPGRIFLAPVLPEQRQVGTTSYSLRYCGEGRPGMVACFLQVWHRAVFVITQNAPVVHVHSDASGNFGCDVLTVDARWLQVHSDASGKFGCDVLTVDARWLQVQWPDSWANVSIAMLYCALQLPRVSYVAADALSRDNMLFLSLFHRDPRLWCLGRSATCCCGNAQIGALFPGSGSSGLFVTSLSSGWSGIVIRVALGVLEWGSLCPDFLRFFRSCFMCFSLVGEYATRHRMGLHCCVAASGIDVSRFNGHSFRIGAATTVAACGLEDSLIQVLGWWKSLAFTQHILTPRCSMVGVAQTLMASH
uniref:Reverse transcriptase domain-containing protein n=1 Tax=Amphimedon queenslandica TaxID=400682 RepID=A0A1X7VB28_AMPQE